MNDRGWQARIDPSAFLRDAVKLWLWRRVDADRIELLCGDGTVRTAVAAYTIDETTCPPIAVPTDALDAIRAAIDAHLGDRPTTSGLEATVRVLTEALAVERARVDHAFDALLPKASA